MKKTNFLIKISKKLIPKKPYKIKENTKLLIYIKKKKKIIHEKLKNLYKYLNKNDVLVRNNTKAIPYIIIGNKDNIKSKIKILLIKELNKKKNIWDTLVKPARKIRVGNKIYFKYKNNNNYLIAEIIDNTTSRGRIIKFINKNNNKKIKKKIKKIAYYKVPHYINQNNITNIKYYQNLYAKKNGSILLPTEGINFTKNLFLKLILKNIKITDITIHNNLYNLKKIDIENLSNYKINSEELIINKKNCKIINKAKINKNKICSLGVNTLKALEYSINYNNLLKKNHKFINKFIYSPFKFKIVDYLISLFHYPNTLPFITLKTFCGSSSHIYKIYNEAIKKNYKFLFYGDLILIK
ncbi:MAG: S-adenosylmethionine:tRNA ribosyltransferase-isomerase [Candidatus Shikimatogenerans sp. JK-2022]|nr:S-adenosylmethionine:tRNA ribosyltransferase-isomerase [Candidatus Shikimatogenerans bostrichidophilus]